MSNKCVHEWYYRIVDIVSWQFFCIRCGEKLSMDKFSDRATDLEKNADALNTRIAELAQAVGLITTLKPTMVMDIEHPLDMAKEVEMYVTSRIAELEAEVTKCHELQDSYCDRIAELEKDVEYWRNRHGKLLEFVAGKEG